MIPAKRPSEPDQSLDSVEAQLIGRGLTSEVYAWGEGRALKLFHRGRPVEKVEAEYRATKAVHAAGFPAPRVFDLIEHGGRLGIVFERLDGRSLFEEVQSRPWTLFTAAKQMAALHSSLHALECPSEIPSLKTRLRKRLLAASLLSAEERAGALGQLEMSPDGDSVCHGDFHPANIIRCKRGLIVIDWGAAARGPGVADVAVTSRLFDLADLPPWAPRYMHWLLKCSRSMLHRTYLSRYMMLRPYRRADVDDWKRVINAAATTAD